MDETWIGRTVGEVYIESLLGRGGMADVYLGKHNRLNRQVAIKILHEPIRSDPALMRFFRAEADALTSMQHPNIVRCIDCDVIQDRPYIVMEVVHGITLQERLAHLHTLGLLPPLHIVRQVVCSAAEALNHAHARGIVHRDVKPANIMLLGSDRQLQTDVPLPEDVQVVVADFGLAQLAQATSTVAGNPVVGTPAYMSPEQITGGKADSRSDVYALGIVLFEMLAGRVPFQSQGKSLADILYGHTHLLPPSVPNLAANIQRVVDRALAKDPSARFPTAGEFAQALEAAITGETIRTLSPA
ncbi:MAG: serine/threonine-protein kinase [Anaerolineales bacterium]